MLEEGTDIRTRIKKKLNNWKAEVDTEEKVQCDK